MAKNHSDGSVAEPQPNDFKFRKLLVNLGNEYVRLATANRRSTIMRALKKFTLSVKPPMKAPIHIGTAGPRMICGSCYLALKPISPQMANDFRRWASALLKSGDNNKLALKCLTDGLVIRTWIEEP